MKSVILEKLVVGGKAVANLFTKSGVYKIISKIQGWFSDKWEKSTIINCLKKEIDEEDSLLSKAMHLPATLFKLLNKKIGAWLSDKIEKSFLLDIARNFMYSVLALNTRFLGCFLLSNTLLRCVANLSCGRNELVILAVGALLLVLNYNITDFFDSSKLIGFLKKASGLQFNFSDVYKKEYAGTIKAFTVALLFGALTSLMPLVLGAILLFGTAVVFAVMTYPVAGVFLALAAAPFVPTMALAGVCILTTASLLIKSLTDRDFKWRKEGIGIGFFLFLMFLSSVFSFAPKKSIMVWGMYLIFAGFYFVIVNTLRTKEQVYGILRVFALFGALVALYGIMQYLFGWNTSNAWIDEEMFEEATMRVYSTMENPNVLGEYLLLLIPIAAIFIFRKKGNPIERVIYAGIFIVACVCMILTQSRGCWLGLILAVAVFITFYNGKLWALAPLALLALPFLMPETMIDRLLSVGDMEDSSTSYRVFIWKGTFRMLRDFWIGGIGMGEGAFRMVYPVYSYIGIIAPHSHNTFLQLLVEGGIGALCVFVGIIIAFFKKVAKLFRTSDRNGTDNLIALAIGSGVFGFLVQSMFDYTFYNYRMMAMFFMILAVAVSLKACKGEEK